MENSITLLQQDNVSAIAAQAPEAFKNNQLSHDKCLEVGEKILEAIRNGGMTDELDEQAAHYIEKSRKTVSKMNEQRSPVTKLFDEMRKAYTTLENEINPTTAGSVPNLLQQERNKYAARKREEAERIRQEQERKRMVETQNISFERDLENALCTTFDAGLNGIVQAMNSRLTDTTLENYSEVEQYLQGFKVEFGDTEWACIKRNMTFRTSLYPMVTPEKQKEICHRLKDRLYPRFKEQYVYEISSNRDEILALLPSKRKELETIAQASAEKAEKRRLEMQQREAEEAARREAERIRKEQEAKAKAVLERQQAEAMNLFNQTAAATPVYQAKTSVKKKIEILNPQGIIECLNMWWLGEGCNLSVEELQKMFKKQITFCEKQANDKSDPKFIESEHIRYVEEVKAK